MSNKPCCPECGQTDSLVIEATGYWSGDRWEISDGNDYEVFCNEGSEGCGWEGEMSNLNWVQS